MSSARDSPVSGWASDNPGRTRSARLAHAFATSTITWCSTPRAGRRFGSPFGGAEQDVAPRLHDRLLDLARERPPGEGSQPRARRARWNGGDPFATPPRSGSVDGRAWRSPPRRARASPAASAPSGPWGSSTRLPGRLRPLRRPPGSRLPPSEISSFAVAPADPTSLRIMMQRCSGDDSLVVPAKGSRLGESAQIPACAICDGSATSSKSIHQRSGLEDLPRPQA